MNWKIMILVAAVIASCSPNKSNEEVSTLTSAPEMINDPHSYAEPVQSLVTHLDWKANVDFETKVITAEATLSLQNAGDAAQVVLDTKALTIESVTSNGEELDFVLGENDEFLGQPLSIKISPETTAVTIKYTTSENAEALQWLSPVQTADKKAPFLFTQSQAILARSWVPIQDSPGIRFTYNAEVTVPSNLLALMSAENPTEKNESGTYSFKMEQPIPAYLLALAVGDLEFKPLGPRSGVYAEPSVVEGAAYEFEDLEKMITAAEELYGPYRWDQYDLIVLPPSFPFGGMENPRLTFATPTILAGDKSLTSLVAHELAHSWSGNLVTNATWNDFWLNEGFTVYFEQRIMEKLYGRDYSEMLASLAAQDLGEEVDEMMKSNKDDTKLKLALDGRNPDDGMTSIAYDKGYLFLRSLEEEIGREKFDTFLKYHFDANAFKVMTTEEFVDELKTELYEKNGLAFNSDKVNAWIYEPGLPADKPQPTSDKFMKVDEQWAKLGTETALTEINTEDWSSHEWLHFVRNIPNDYTKEQMAELDAAFGFTKTGNSEVLTEWLVQSVKRDYEGANDRLSSFLINTGRRKFLMPLYKELIKTDAGMTMAKNIYADARPNYHFVSTNSIDALLNYKEN